MKNAYNIGMINGALCLESCGEYILDTEGEPLYTESDSWEDLFGDASPAEIDAQLHPATATELASINSAGFRDWIAAKEV